MGLNPFFLYFAYFEGLFWHRLFPIVKDHPKPFDHLLYALNEQTTSITRKEAFCEGLARETRSSKEIKQSIHCLRRARQTTAIESHKIYRPLRHTNTLQY